MKTRRKETLPREVMDTLTVFRIWELLTLTMGRLTEGMGAEEKRKKTKIIPGTQPKARAGWPKRLRLVQATPWADFAVLDVQLCSTLFNSVQL